MSDPTTSIIMGVQSNHELVIGGDVLPNGTIIFDSFLKDSPSYESVCSNIDRATAEAIIAALRVPFPEKVEPTWGPGRCVVEYSASLMGAETVAALAKAAGATGVTVEPGGFSDYVVRRDYYVPESYWKNVYARHQAGVAVDLAINGE